MFRSVPLFALAMTAGLAAAFFSGFRPVAASGSAARIESDSDAWFI